MRIGFDFDKVFVDFPPLVPYKVIDYLYKKKNHVLAYRIPAPFEQHIRIFTHHQLLRQPIKENINTLSNIVEQKDIEAFLISGRFGFLRQKTEKWLKKNHMEKYFRDVYFNFENEQPHLFKDRILKKLHIEKFIDDDLELLLYLAKQNPNVKFFWLTDAKNKITQLPKNVTPVKNLKDFSLQYL